MNTRQRGLSLIELIVVIALAILLLTLALPALGHWIARQQLQAARDDIVQSLELARKTATSRQKLVWVEFSLDGKDWLLRVSEQKDGKGCAPGRDLRCTGSGEHGGVALSRPGKPLPLKLAFSPLHGMPQDEEGRQLREVELRLYRPQCQPVLLRLLATGLISSGASSCP